jgi:hypothetical protein
MQEKSFVLFDTNAIIVKNAFVTYGNNDNANCVCAF